MIEIKNITAGYSSKKILKNINCIVEKGSFSGIIGRNGAGKSTLLKVLCGQLKPFYGEVFLNGKDVYSISKKVLSKAISFMPQSVDMNFPFTVKEFVMFGRYPYMNIFKIPSQKDYAVVNKVLKFTNIETFSERYVDELSGGEKQKVLIAQTIVQETDIMVFDEPASHLDMGNQADILCLLKMLNKKYGKTIVITLHDLNAAGEFCDNLILMEDGNIRNSGTVQKVLNYKDIEEVYKTTVVVKTNPMSGKPYVIPVSKNEQ
ncbi:MAG: ABC transporter ATP-binding protein [Endomicrobium sp.]|jgi:iron complex transport system ATP-binding protein|nr:ABC transporter ATP-binding protein [Endomicrobium sp.]